MHLEIPRDLLDKVLEDPGNAAWVDGLIFSPDGGGSSAAATWSDLSDEELESRFTWPHLTVTAEQRRLLASYDCGKLGAFEPWNAEAPFFYLLNAADHPDQIDLEYMLSIDDDGSDALADAWGTAVGEPALVHASHRSHTVDGVNHGIASNVACYGISGYRTPEDLAGIWRKVDRIVTRYPDLVGPIVDRFDTEIRYYYGCFARGSADLHVIW